MKSTASYSFNTSFWHRTIRSRLCIVLPTLLLLFSARGTSFAGSATWQLNPTSGDWNTAANWMPSTDGSVPNGPFDTATFGPSYVTGVSLSVETIVNAIVFNDANASAFTINTESLVLRIFGAGVINHSGITQNIIAGSPFGLISFLNNSTAGIDVTYTIEPDPTNGQGFGGSIFFNGSSTAGDATFLFPENTVSNGNGGFILFDDFATAGTGKFNVSGGVGSLAHGARIEFGTKSNADRGTFTVNGGNGSDFLGGGTVGFFQSSGAGAATLIANGGSFGGPGGLIEFADHSHGGSARIKIFGNGSLDISGHKDLKVTVGSLEGSGLVLLGSSNLRVGRNDLDTVFSGSIHDGGLAGGAGGSLTKIGRGKLVLRRRSAYTGGTIVRHGKLMVNNLGGSGTGTGPVQVEGGQLGGKGRIAGAVTIGTGSGAGAALSPGYLHGIGRPGALTIQSSLIFNSDAIYRMELSSSNVTADGVIAGGVTINVGAQFTFNDIGSAILPPGTTFTVINNTVATPIGGTFSNLADGATFTYNGNSYRVDYEGGDGNDLTLTVVP